MERPSLIALAMVPAAALARPAVSLEDPNVQLGLAVALVAALFLVLRRLFGGSPQPAPRRGIIPR